MPTKKGEIPDTETRQNLAASTIQRFMRKKREYINRTMEFALLGTEGSAVRFKEFEKKLWEEDYRLQSWGLETIRDLTFSSWNRALRIENRYSSEYTRDRPGFKQLIQSVEKEYTPPGKKGYLVNGPYVFEKIKKFYDDCRNITPEIRPISKSLSLLIFDNKKINIDTEIYTVGGMPCAIDVLKHCLLIQQAKKNKSEKNAEGNVAGGGASADQQGAPSKTVDMLDVGSNAEITDTTLAPLLNALFNQMIKSREFLFLKIKGARTDGIGFIASTVHRLFTSLSHSICRIENTGTINEKLLVKSALEECQRLFQQFSIHLNSGQLNRQHELYRLFTEEINLILLLDDGYDVTALEAITTRHKTRKYSFPEGAEVSCFLTSSGMDAIATALSGLMQIKGIDKFNLYSKTPIQDYFEVNAMLSNKKSDCIESQVVGYCTLQASNPVLGFGGDDGDFGFQCFLKDPVDLSFLSDDQYYTLVIDITIENNPGWLNRFFKLNEQGIKEGKLNVVLCKSLQKFDLLGMVKTSAGEITMINCGGEKFLPLKNIYQEYSHSTLREQEPSTRLIRQTMKYVGDKVLQFENIARENVEFLRDVVFHGRNYRIYCDPYTPLLAVLNGIEGHLCNSGIYRRDGFATIQVAYCHISSSLRLSPGLETKQRLFEQFYIMHSSLNFSNRYKVNQTLLSQALHYFVDELNLKDDETANLKAKIDDHEYAPFIEQLKSISKNARDTRYMKKYALNALVSLLTNLWFKDPDISEKLYACFIDNALLDQEVDITPDGRVYFANTYLRIFNRIRNDDDKKKFFVNNIDRLLKCVLLLPEFGRIDFIKNLSFSILSDPATREKLKPLLVFPIPHQIHVLTALFMKECSGRDFLAESLIKNISSGNVALERIFALLMTTNKMVVDQKIKEEACRLIEVFISQKNNPQFSVQHFIEKSYNFIKSVSLADETFFPEQPVAGGGASAGDPQRPELLTSQTLNDSEIVSRILKETNMPLAQPENISLEQLIVWLELSPSKTFYSVNQLGKAVREALLQLGMNPADLRSENVSIDKVRSVVTEKIAQERSQRLNP